MKRILVPTDFSDCAGYAAKAAFLIAKKFGAELLFYHQTDKDHIENKLEDVIENFEKIKTDPQFKGVSIRTVHSNGALIEKILELCELEAIDLIVMGSHGASGYNEMMIGSNTQKTVRFANCPVLTIKHPIDEINFKKIIFASDFNRKTKSAYEKLLSFAKMFDSEIHLLTIDTRSFFAQPYFLMKQVMDDYKNMDSNVKVETHIFPDQDIENGINKYSEFISADLVVIPHYGDRPLKRLIWFSISEGLVNHMDLPVLSINC